MNVFRRFHPVKDSIERNLIFAIQSIKDSGMCIYVMLVFMAISCFFGFLQIVTYNHNTTLQSWKGQ